MDKVLYPKTYVVDLGLSTLSVKRNITSSERRSLKSTTYLDKDKLNYSLTLTRPGFFGCSVAGGGGGGGVDSTPPPPRDLGRRLRNCHENWHTRYLWRNLPNKNKNKNVNDIALIRHLATSNITNFMWYNFLLVKK